MLPERPVRSAVVVFLLAAALYLIELVDQVLPADLDQNGILPRSVDGLDGILWAPLLHSGWDHLAANSLPFLVLGWLVMSGGIGSFIGLTAVIWIIGGLGTWLVGAPGAHVGASGVIFGWMVYLLVRGFFQRSFGQILVAVVLFFYWGGMLWGVVPGQPGISWEGHLFGAVGGLLAAWLVAKRTSRRAASSSTGTLTA